MGVLHSLLLLLPQWPPSSLEKPEVYVVRDGGEEEQGEGVYVPTWTGGGRGEEAGRNRGEAEVVS